MINDIYGKTTINSPVIISLIKSKPLQRLKKISQFGIPDKYYHLKNYSRYEHSVGVMILLKKLGASEEEQIAGLLHDVSHTAFSHVIDWVVGSGKTEDYQDNQHTTFILNSTIPQILQKYGYNANKISSYKHFGLLEQALPDICADRVDYSLREFKKEITKKCISSLINRNNKMAFADKSTALLFAKNFLKQQETHWGGFEAASRYRLFADALKIALTQKIITMDDLWKTDSLVINKLEKSKDADIKKILKALKHKSLKKYPKSKVVVHKKFRYVDPLFLKNGKLQRLSSFDFNFKAKIKKAKLENEKGVTIPLI